MVVKAPSVERSIISSFGQFYLLSALPEDLAPFSYANSSRNFTEPFFCKSINVIDQYPQVISRVVNEQTPD